MESLTTTRPGVWLPTSLTICENERFLKSRIQPRQSRSEGESVCFSVHRWYDTNQRWMMMMMMMAKRRRRRRRFLLDNLQNFPWRSVSPIDFSFMMRTYNVVNTTWGLTKTLTEVESAMELISTNSFTIISFETHFSFFSFFYGNKQWRWITENSYLYVCVCVAQCVNSQKRTKMTKFCVRRKVELCSAT